MPRRPTSAPRARTRRAVAVVLAAAVAAATAACTDEAAAPEPSGPGDGVLTTLSLGPVRTWDPQRITSRQDAAFATRTWMRTLTAYAPATGDDPAQLVGDLATDTGTVDRSLRTWTFTLRDGVRWQDGSDITCADVAYGISRGFASDLEGPNWAPSVLAVPRTAAGESTYAGPFSGDGQEAFDEAVTCKDRTLTVRLGIADADFDEMVTLPAFAPVRAAQDRGQASRYTVFASGPYLLQGEWEPSAGGTFVRNPHWSAESDPVRRASVGEIRYQEGVETQSAIQRVMASEGVDATSVALAPAPPALQQQINGSEPLSDRAVEVADQLVDYLAPVWSSPVMKNATARKALATATNRSAYVTALGGSRSAVPAYSVIPPPVPGRTGTDPFDGGETGDPAAARTLLESSRLTLPVPLRVAYRSGETADKAMAALQAGWESAGFEVTLQPLDESYFDTVADADRVSGSDVFWSSWEPAWPSAAAVLPVLFDSRLNLSQTSSGRDLGRYADAETNAEITRIGLLADDEARAEAWGELDRTLLAQGAYIGLAHRTNTYLAGASVAPLQTSAALGGVLDLARIGLP